MDKSPPWIGWRSLPDVNAPGQVLGVDHVLDQASLLRLVGHNSFQRVVSDGQIE